jgi:hypothetical protein
MDKDEDGVLSLKELKEGLLNRGIHLTDKTAKVGQCVRLQEKLEQYHAPQHRQVHLVKEGLLDRGVHLTDKDSPTRLVCGALYCAVIWVLSSSKNLAAAVAGICTGVPAPV